MGNNRPVESLETLLKESDFVTLHVPETPQTKGMIGKHEIEMMKNDASLLNLSRGSVVDLDALADAIKGRRLPARRSTSIRRSPRATRTSSRASCAGSRTSSSPAHRRLDGGGTGVDRPRGREHPRAVHERGRDDGDRQLPDRGAAEARGRPPRPSTSTGTSPACFATSTRSCPIATQTSSARSSRPTPTSATSSWTST